VFGIVAGMAEEGRERMNIEARSLSFIWTLRG
jgi:hypothetical protein